MCAHRFLAGEEGLRVGIAEDLLEKLWAWCCAEDDVDDVLSVCFVEVASWHGVERSWFCGFVGSEGVDDVAILVEGGVEDEVLLESVFPLGGVDV